MSILIKGMEMPPDCFRCKLSFMSGERLFCSAMKNEEVLRAKIDPNCPLIEIPPHGRLIDADALKLDLTRFYDGEVTAKRLIDEQSTIIPAEEGGI